MKTYKNTKTNVIITTDCIISGGNWVEVKKKNNSPPNKKKKGKTND